MSVSDYFSTFCSNLRMSSDTVSTIQYRYHQITKRINLDYRNSSSETAYSMSIYVFTQLFVYDNTKTSHHLDKSVTL